MKNKLRIAVIDPLLGYTYSGVKNTLHYVASHLIDDHATIQKETRMSFEMLSDDGNTIYEYAGVHNERFADDTHRCKFFDQVLVANYFETTGPVSENYYETKLMTMGYIDRDTDIFNHLLRMSCVPPEYKIIHMKDGYETGYLKAYLLNTELLG